MRLSSPSPRGIAAIVVLLAWGGSLGWLAARQLGRSETSTLTTAAALRLAPGDAWFAVMAGETQVGVVGITVDTLSPGYRVLENAWQEYPEGTGTRRVNRSTEITLGPSLALTELVSRLMVGARREETRITVANGRTTQIIQTPTSTTTGESTEGPVPVPLLVASYRLALTGALGAGEERTLPFLAGWPAAIRPGTAIPGSEVGVGVYSDSAERNADGAWVPLAFDTVETRTVILDAPTGPIRLTVDPRGTLIALEHPLGTTWRRDDFGIVQQAFSEGLADARPRIRAALPDLESLTAAVRGPGADSTPARFMVTHRDGSALAPWALEALAGGRQRMRGNGLLVVAARDLTGPRLGEAPVRDPFIQESDPGVQALAAELAVPIAEDDWGTVIRRLAARVRFDTAAAAPVDAAGALAAGRARADGIARLFVAVVRAGGGMARYAVGVAPRGEMLYTHAWAEVRSRGRGSWSSIDPALGRVTADTDLIRIGWGGSSHPEDLMPHVANVRFTPAPRPTDGEEAP